MNHIFSTENNFIDYIQEFKPWDGPYDRTPLFGAREMRNMVPEWVWEDKNTTILDPYFGWGTFLYVCYEKLKLHHTDEYIFTEMLHGNEIELFQYQLLVDNLPTFNTTNFRNIDSLTMETHMKPTVILTNPPYETSGGANNEKDWAKHCMHQIETNRPRYFIPVIPNQAISEVGINGQKLRKNFKDNSYGFIKAVNHTKKWFKANIDTCHFMLKEHSEDKIDPIIIKNAVKKDPILESIIEKIVNSVDTRLPLQTQNDKIPRTELSKSGKNEIYFSGEKLERTDKLVEGNGQLKLVFPFSSSYHKMFITDKPVGMLNHYLPINTIEEGENIKKCYLKNLFLLVADSYRRTSGFCPFVKNKKVPDLRFNSDWTKEELYKHFNLTKKEIEFVNNGVR